MMENKEDVSRETIGDAVCSQKSRKGLLLLAEAFLLAALCFAVYQWNGAVKEAQALREQVSILQGKAMEAQAELAEAQAAAEAFQDSNETSRNQAPHLEHLLERTQEAMGQFWQLDGAYRQGDSNRCRTILEAMRQNADDPMEQYLTPELAARYQEIAAAARESE